MGIKRETTIDDDGVIVSTKDYCYTIFDNDKGYLFRNKAYYIKGYQGIKMSKVLDNKIDIANMYLLAENLYKDTNMISIYRNKRYFPADIVDIAKMLNLCERNARDFINRMIDKGLIAKNTIKIVEDIKIHYHINPLYFNTNKYLSPALYMMFREQLDEYLPEWVIRKFNEK